MTSNKGDFTMATEAEYQQLIRCIRYEIAELMECNNSDDSMYAKIIKMCNAGLPSNDQETDPSTIYNDDYPKLQTGLTMRG